MSNWWETAPIVEQPASKNWWDDAPTVGDPQNPDGTFGTPPEGMTLNPATGQMEDLQSPNNPNIPQGGANAAMLGVGQGLGFNFLDEAVAGASALTGGDYDYDLARMREAERRASDEHPWSYYGGTIGGALGTGVGLVGSGASLGANAINAGQGLGRVALASGIEGAALGAGHGFGGGEGVEDRALDAGKGALGGLALGAGLPVGIAGAAGFLKPYAANVGAYFNPSKSANAALGETLRRSGMSADEVSAVLSRSQADGQDMFTVADALGHAGQRSLSTIVRNPSDARQQVVDALTGRQMGQSERLVQSLARGFDAPDTAAQRAATLKSERSQIAAHNYEAARADAGAVDVSGAIRATDDVLAPGVNRLANPGSNIADDSLEGVVRRVRGLLTDGNSQITDFNSAMRASQDIGDMIGSAARQGRNNQVRILSDMKRQLDAGLERSSPLYRQANDTFRDQSRAIDAVETGRNAASSRVRSADSIQSFQNLRPGEQSAFRAGYVDPMIARIEAASLSPTTNKARMLMTGKSGEEFPAFAVPQRADRMGREISREQRMFETANAALGGSKTADNLADATDLSRFDPGIISTLMQRGPVAAAMQGIGSVAGVGRGQPQSVTELVAKALLETNPDAARTILGAGAGKVSKSDAHRAIVNAFMNNIGSSETVRGLNQFDWN